MSTIEERSSVAVQSTVDRLCPNVQDTKILLDDRTFDIRLTKYTDRFFFVISETGGNFATLIDVGRDSTIGHDESLTSTVLLGDRTKTQNLVYSEVIFRQLFDAVISHGRPEGKCSSTNFDFHRAQHLKDDLPTVLSSDNENLWGDVSDNSDVMLGSHLELSYPADPYQLLERHLRVQDSTTTTTSSLQKEKTQQKSNNDTQGGFTEPNLTKTTTKRNKLKKESESQIDGIQIRKVNKAPLDILMEDEKDLTILASALKQAEFTKNDGLRNIAATVFAPIDSAFDFLPIDFVADTEIDFPNRTEYGTNIFEYHIVAPRLVTPQMIPINDTYQAKTRFSPHSLMLRKYNRTSSIGNTTIIIDGYAEVKEIIQARRGWIYKIDAVLGPEWNKGPTLLDFVKQTSWLSKSRYLLEASNIFDTKTESLGPVTIFLVPDWGWKLNGFELPNCVFQTLTRPENKNLLRSILQWLTVPGLWSPEEIRKVNYLPNASPPQLRVAHVFSPSRRRLLQARPPHQPPVFVSTYPESTTYLDPRYAEHTFVDQITLIEGREVTKWSIPLHNGWVHVLSELPPITQFEPVAALWDCVHEFCFQCPKISGHLLQFFDEGGLIPSHRPLEYVVPSGVRPNWVCRGSTAWFPPGWDPKQWDTYIEHARKGHARAAKESQIGSIAAAQKIGELRYKHDDAKTKLKHIKTGSSLDTQSFKPLWDPGSLVSFVTSTRQFNKMPDCQYKDDVEQLTMNDLKYLTRWM